MQEKTAKKTTLEQVTGKQEFLEQDDAPINISQKFVYVCPKCESLLVLKEGANGAFLGGESYPVC